jgi:long-chain acyl-CoA synthetase
MSGTVGEIFIRNRNMPEFDYIGDARSARDEVVRDSHVTQGDLGYLDEEGFLYLAGRKREMIVSGGVNIYTVEIESTLAAMAGVRWAAAFPVPDQEYGEVIGVAVELDGSHHVDADAVRTYLRMRLGRLKEPRIVEFRRHLPVNEAGKITKLEFTRKYWPQSPRR